MYDIHVGDKFANKVGGTYVTVVELLPLEDKVKYKYDGSGIHRTVDRTDFLERFPLAQ